MRIVSDEEKERKGKEGEEFLDRSQDRAGWLGLGAEDQVREASQDFNSGLINPMSRSMKIDYTSTTAAALLLYCSAVLHALGYTTREMATGSTIVVVTAI